MNQFKNIIQPNTNEHVLGNKNLNYVHIYHYQLSIESSNMIIQLFVVLVRIIHNDGTIVISINIYHIFHEKLDGYLISTSLNPPHTIFTRYWYNIETLWLGIQLFVANSNEKELFDKMIQLDNNVNINIFHTNYHDHVELR